VPSGSQILRLDPGVIVADVSVFSRALACGRHADAAREYAGPLLDGFHVDDAPEFERWLDGERARLAREYAEGLEQLAAAAERAGAWHEAAGWWGRAVAHDPLNSHLVLRQVRALAAIGDRANALKAADVHARRLREELDLEPDSEVVANIARIRRGELDARRSARAPLSPGPGVPPPGDESPRIGPAAPSGAGTPDRRPGAASGRPRWARWAMGAGAVVVLAGAVGVGPLLRTRGAAPRPPRTAIAVLPFRTLEADSSHAYLAGGLHDELLAQLAGVASLRVIGPKSVRDYQQTSKKPLRQIADELGVGSIVETSVQVVGSRLRVIVQLLDPMTEEELWAERYDSTLDNAFAVQSAIARRIVEAVGATLTSAEAAAIVAAPTQNSQAYAFYLQGLEYWRRPGVVRRNLEIAQQLFERAVALDSAFALAHAALSSLHWTMYYLPYDQTAARLALARREAEVALRLAPNLPRAHFAIGLARHVARGDNRGALDEFNVALRGSPNDPEVWAWVGRVYRRLGNWDSVMVAFDHARRLDPRDANLLISLGETLHYLHRYREAIQAYRHALALAPDLTEPRLSLAWSYVLWKGELDTLRTVLQDLPLDADPGGGGENVADQRLALLYWERRPDSMLALLDAVPKGAESVLSRVWTAAQAHALQGDSAAARAGFEAASALLSSMERERPDDPDVHATRGLTLAWLGRRLDALREAHWLERSEARHDDRWDSGPAQDLARLLVRVGETDTALVVIERLLAGPSRLGVGELRLSPEFDPIRRNPRFQALLAKYADPATL
jgi:TolB-like protein/Flp pilus assembly protein TadD